MLRAGLAGAASGSRSQLAIAALSLTAPTATRSRGPAGRIDALLRSRIARGIVVTAAAAELIGDKLPQAPSRLSPPALGTRLVLGGLAGALIAARGGTDQRASAITAAVAAAVSSVVGSRARAALTRRLGSDLPGAFAEDAVALSLAAISARAG